MIIIPVSGKWQKRIVHTLAESSGALTTRQLSIRCGRVYSGSDTLFKNIVYRLVARRIVLRVKPGLFILRSA